MEFTINTNLNVDVRYTKNPDLTATVTSVDLSANGQVINVMDLLDDGIVEDLEVLISEEIQSDH